VRARHALPACSPTSSIGGGAAAGFSEVGTTVAKVLLTQRAARSLAAPPTACRSSTPQGGVEESPAALHGSFSAAVMAY